MFPTALFLDRDATLIVDHPYLADPEKVELIAGVKETLHRFAASHCRFFLFTNQSGIGRGLFTLETAQRCNQRMIDLLELPAPGFTEICIAPEHPDMPSVYRKPSPQFILEMIAKYSLDPRTTWMVGDKVIDVQAGLNAGIRSARIIDQPDPDSPVDVLRCRDFPDFCRQLIELDEAPVRG